jgi:glucose-1-phosphate cytidylyltransferase
VIKEYFANYFLHMSDVTLDMSRNTMEVHSRKAEPWRITIVDTGLETLTGGRLARVRSYVRDETFCFTYGDGVADIDIGALVAFHRSSGRIATLTAVQPPGRYGALGFESSNTDLVAKFQEKPEGDGAWINGGFFVLPPPGNGRRWRSWRPNANWPPTATAVFGGRWIPCATRWNWKNCGAAGRLPGNPGAEHAG